MKRTALVFGATGLIGTELVKQLAENETYEQVTAFVRHEPVVSHPKITRLLYNPENRADWVHLVKGNDLFCCLGTTMKKARTKENFEKADLHLPVFLAETAGSQNIERFIVVSSIGANPLSSSFYLRTKGKMEQMVRSFPDLRVIIVRPSMLLGKRQELRLGEELGKRIMKPAGWLLTGKWKKYRAIHASVVAMAMVRLATSDQSHDIVESDELQTLGG